jgi:hypothetical protein
MKDTKAMTEYFLQRNPFGGHADLKSISSGVVSTDSDADNAKEVGEKLIGKMRPGEVLFQTLHIQKERSNSYNG